MIIYDNKLAELTRKSLDVGDITAGHGCCQTGNCYLYWSRGSMTSYNLYLIRYRYAYRFFTCQKTEPKTDSKHRCTRLTAYRCTRLIIMLLGLPKGGGPAPRALPLDQPLHIHKVSSINEYIDCLYVKTLTFRCTKFIDIIAIGFSRRLEQSFALKTIEQVQHNNNVKAYSIKQEKYIAARM